MVMKFIQIIILFQFYSIILSEISDNQQINSVEQDKRDKYWPQTEPELSSPPGLSNKECVRKIYKECNYPTVFTDEELENVRQFLNYSFTVLADIKPDKPLCPKLHVRQDWKCLTQQQKTRVINVWKQMYERGDVQRLAEIHVKTWPSWHKTSEFYPGHIWFLNEFDRIMQSYDHKVTLPYFDIYTYATQPERSSIWDTLGHSGSYSNGYSVPDGVYANWDLVPTIKRHWSPRGTIYPWFTHEFLTFTLQTLKTYPDYLTGLIGHHFSPHLNIGGYEGQYSYRNAPYDCLFYMQHISSAHNNFLRFQLQHSPHSLTPLEYISFAGFNAKKEILETADIRTATLQYNPNITIREMFWIGFGRLCSIPDQLVKPISNLWKGVKEPVPTAIKRLPKWILKKYYPAFYSGNFSGIYHTFEDVGDCNRICRPIPKPTFMRETEQGRRQFDAYRYDIGLDLTQIIERIEAQLHELWSDLNKSGYCSPYVTNY